MVDFKAATDMVALALALARAVASPWAWANAGLGMREEEEVLAVERPRAPATSVFRGGWWYSSRAAATVEMAPGTPPPGGVRSPVTVKPKA